MNSLDLIAFLNGYNIEIKIEKCDSIGCYCDENRTILIDPYYLDLKDMYNLILKHEAVHAVQHIVCEWDNLFPFKTKLFRSLNLPYHLREYAFRTYQERYEGDWWDLAELQAMTLETMSYKDLIDIFKYIISQSVI